MNVKALDVFFSYSHKEENLRDDLATHLKILERQGQIRTWHDREITAGQEWAGKIDAHLESADIILLLVRPDFVDSDYCWDLEMKRALERHEAGTARVIPIILHPVDWSEAPFGKLQALPRNAKPVTTWPNRDEAFLNVVQERRAGSGRTTQPAPSQLSTTPSVPVRSKTGYQVLREEGVIEELASIFSSEEAAYSLLEEAGIPRTRIRPFGRSTPIQFWQSVCQELENGLTERGLSGLIAEALRQYPHNKALQQGASLLFGTSRGDGALGRVRSVPNRHSSVVRIGGSAPGPASRCLRKRESATDWPSKLFSEGRSAGDRPSGPGSESRSVASGRGPVSSAALRRGFPRRPR